MFHSQLIAAADPTPFNKPRFIAWPSVCDTTRTNWFGPEESDPTPLSPALENHVEYACMFDPHFEQPIDPRVLAACSSIDCIAPPADASLIFTAISAPPIASPELYSTTICSPGIPMPPPLTPHLSPPLRSKRGRPLVFDEVKRAEFIGMLKAGFTIRYAARRVGVSHTVVFQARDRDPLFAARIVKAQQDRDLHCVRRIHNAGKKSWRAAAWILERVQPKEFSLNHKNRDPWTIRGQRRLKELINEILDSRFADHPKTGSRNPLTDQALRLIDDRLEEIDSQYDSYDEPDDEVLDDDSRATDERGGVGLPISHDDLDDQLDHTEDTDQSDDYQSDHDDLDEDEPDEDFEENDGFESVEAAVGAYRQNLRKLKVRNCDIEAEVEHWRRQLRRFNARLRRRPQRS
jgi:hypothetical protein